MNNRLHFLTVAITSALAVLFIWFMIASPAGSAGSQKTVYDMSLNPDGGAFELNEDSAGHLWVSDYDAGEIWELDPVSGEVTVYEGMVSPADARHDGNGNVWYAEASANQLGQLSTITETITLWEAPGSSGLYATQIDPDGHIWATDGSAAGLFRLVPGSGQMCRYEIPSTAASLYVEANEEGVWLADGNGETIFRLDPAANEFTLWQLPTAGFPSGLDLDPAGNLWWADYDLGTVNRLEAGINRMAVFTPTISSYPVMLDTAAETVWFTDDLNSRIGRLSPSTASSTTLTLVRSTVAVTPSCTIIEPAALKPITVTTELKSFTKAGYDLLVESDNWMILEVPDLGAPYGVRIIGSDTWIVDYGRQVLSRIPSDDSYSIYLPAIRR